MRLLLAALLLSIPAAPAGAQTSPSKAALALAGERALHLAELFGPPELLAEQTLREAKRQFDDMVATDPQSRATEAKWPGLHAFVWREVEPQMRSDVLRAEKATARRIAALFQARLAPDEIDGLIRYASAPPVLRLTRDAIAGIRTAPHGQPPAPTAGLARRLTADFADGLAPDELRDLAGIISTLPKEKFRALGAEVSRIRMEAVLRDEPVHQTRTHTAMQAAMRRFIARRARR